MSYTLKDAEKQWVNPYFGLPNRNISNLVADDDVDNINSTIKPIDREDSNLEAEKNELVFQPTGELYTVRGKSHAKGGTPLNLPKGAFLFSNYKPLAISKEDKEQFEFKKGGSNKLSLNTPAKVLSREIDIKHHNKMLAILKSDKHDEISKTSARLMLEKNLPKIGQVAFLQEEKKSFPDGIPDFSQGTAPSQENVDYMKKQFKMGGTNNPYLEKYQEAGKVKIPYPLDNETPDYGNVKGIVQGAELAAKYPWFKPFTAANTTKGYVTSTGVNSLYTGDKPSQYQNIPYWEGLYGKPFSKMKEFQGFLESQISQKDPTAWAEMNKKYGPTLAGKFPDNLGGARTAEAMDYRFKTPENPKTPFTPIVPYTPQTGFTPRNPAESRELVGQYYNEVPRSALQNLVLGNDMYNALNVQRLNPMRSQQSFVPLTQERINNQPYLNNINNQTASTRAATQVMSPQQAAALLSKTVGQGLDKSSEVLGNINNQNLQISNAENQFNTQGINNTAAQNVGLNQQYYDQTQKAEGNYQNTKDILRNNALKTFVNQSADNERLRQNLDSLKTEGPVYVNPKTNLPIKDTDLVEEAKKEGITPEQYISKYKLKKQSMAPMFFNPYTRRVEHSGINFDPRTISSQSGMSSEKFLKDIAEMDKDTKQAYSRFLIAQMKQNPYN